MARHVAKIICLGLAGVAGWQVGVQVVEVYTDPPWIRWAVSGAVLVVVFVLLYFPLMRPIFDVIGDRLSATRQRFKSTRAGVGLNDIPAFGDDESSRVVLCAYCGAPGRPICDSCQQTLRGE